jgi:capsular polysaccharide biosynthesis protein
MEPELQELAPDPPKKASIDLRAVAIGLVKRLPILILCIVVAAFVGMRGGKKYGKKVYKAETMVRFERHGEMHSETDEKSTLLTLKDTVKTEHNLNTLREKLRLPESTEVVGKACEVQVEKNTTLMTVTAQWKSAPMAATLANGLTEVFIANYRKHVKDGLQAQVRDLQRRLDNVRVELKTSDATLQQFTSQNKVIDIDKQSRAMLEEANSMSVLLEQALAEQKTVEEQSAKLEGVIADLKVRVAKEQASASSMESLSDLNIRIGKLKEAIREDKDYRVNLTEMNLRQSEMERAKALMNEGAISRQEYQRTVAAFEKARIATQDTEQIKSWKVDLERLQKIVIPDHGSTSASGPILQEMMVRTFDIQLQRVAVQEKVLSLRTALTRVKTQLNQMPILQRQYEALSRNVSTLETERKEVEERLAVMERAYDAETPDFSVVTEAREEKDPVSSSGKMISIGAVAGGLILGIVLMLLPELLDTTVRTGKEVGLRLKLPLLGAMPRRRATALFPTDRETRLAERFTLLAQQVRQAAPQRGAHLLFVSATEREGVVNMAANLAACYGRQGEKVLVVDAVADGRDRQPLKEWFGRKPANFALFDDFLHERTDEIDTLPQESAESGVMILSREGKPVSPDRLSATRVCEMYAQLSEQYSLIITIASPIQSGIEAQLLARYADGIVLVTQSRKVRGAVMRRALTKLSATGVPIVGAILTGVTRLYMEKE